MKDKSLYPSCKIYYGKCKQCGEDRVGKTKRNCITRWREHDNLTHKSDPTGHTNIEKKKNKQTRVIDNNYYVLFPTSRFPYLTFVPGSGNGR